MSYAFITHSVGKNGTNNDEDVKSIQIRLCRWIMEGKLPNVAMLAVDGDCGAATKKAIGAFQKLYLGTSNPDCRVDPNGKTLDALFQSLVSKKVSDEAYQAWLKSQSAPAPAPAKPAVDWDLSAKEVADIRKEWGEQILAWAKVPPNGTDSMEFSPQKNSDRYVTVFCWKSLTPNTTCVANPKERIQFLAMLRDDMGFWLQRSGGSQRTATILQYTAACAVRDYRGFIIGQKMCPKSAYYRLVSIGKDMIYQMFLGMFQLLSPVGLAGAAGASGTIAETINKMSEGLTAIKWDDKKSVADNLRNFKWPWMK